MARKRDGTSASSPAGSLQMVQRWLEGKPGVSVKPIYAGRGSTPVSHTYKVGTKLFAVLALRDPAVILKCSAADAEALRERYDGIGHRSHLDARFWICASLQADVPLSVIESLIDASYRLVAASLPRATRDRLALAGA